MFDTSRLIRNFCASHVTLPNSSQIMMRDRRDTNRNRIESGLSANGKQPFVEVINQGSYAMQTMIQLLEDDNSSFDIDMGIVFESVDALSPRVTRNWVKDAIAAKATNMKNVPEDKGKCIRVTYSDGYQCDFPVFKRTKQQDDTFTYQIAMIDGWVSSDPRAINKWFEQKVANQSPEKGGPYQLRRIVKLIKYFSKVRQKATGNKYPGGLLITSIVCACYEGVDNRDDEALYKTLKNISEINENADVYANGIKISREKDATRIGRLKTCASKATESLAILFDDSCDESQAGKAWNKVFKHSYFSLLNEQSNSTISKNSSGNVAAGSLGITTAAATAGVEAAAAASVTKTPPWSN